MGENKTRERRNGKVQIVLLVDAEIVTALDTLRIISETSRARVTEPLLSEAVTREMIASAARAGEIERVHALAERAGMTIEQYVTAYAKAYSRMTYGPGLAALEEDDREVTGKRVKPTPVANF